MTFLILGYNKLISFHIRRLLSKVLKKYIEVVKAISIIIVSNRIIDIIEVVPQLSIDTTYMSKWYFVCQ